MQLFTAAMVLNKRPVSFTNSFTSSLADSVSVFQAFMKLAVNGQGDFGTWSSLLVSYGDQTRQGEACDGITKITPARAQALKSAGYKYIGRYLYNPSTTSLPEKEIQPGELATIKQYGLRCFPIYQTWARSVDYYSVSQGVADCLNAAFKAEEHGFKPGSRIYFAVDYDAMNDEVTSHILPYFRSVKEQMDRLGSPYKIGVYGPRNACSRISAEGYADTSFVSDMSSGFSGNLGYAMPENWAFDQIVTKVVGSGDGRIEIDNNIASGRDTGQGDFHPAPPQKLDIGFNLSHWEALAKEATDCMASIGRGEGSNNIYTRRQCLETVMTVDDVITSAARRYRMRKALIQTSAFWEFCTTARKTSSRTAASASTTPASSRTGPRTSRESPRSRTAAPESGRSRAASASWRGTTPYAPVSPTERSSTPPTTAPARTPTGTRCGYGFSMTTRSTSVPWRTSISGPPTARAVTRKRLRSAARPSTTPTPRSTRCCAATRARWSPRSVTRRSACRCTRSSRSTTASSAIPDRS